MAKKKAKLKKTSTVDFSNIFQDMQEIQEGVAPTPSKKRVAPQIPQEIDGKSIQTVDIKAITPDPDQPRKNIDPESEDIKQLAHSIKKHGFINFITVREKKKGQYIIVAGERRFTAAKVAKLKTIPVFVLDPEKAPLDYALIQLEENLQREDLSPFEEAESYQRLKEEFGLQQKDVAKAVKRDKTYVSRMMKINEMVPEVRTEITKESTGIAKRVVMDLASFSQEDQQQLWKKIKKNPVMSNLQRAAKSLEKRKDVVKGKSKKTGDLPNADMIWDALKKAVQKDKNVLYELLSRKKIETLLQRQKTQIH